MMRWCLPLVASLIMAIGAGLPADAQSIAIDVGEDGLLSERVVQLVILVTILSIAPSILIMATSFVRIVVVLSLLRTAIGLQQSPPNSVIISLSLFLTAFIMAPTFEAAYERGIVPVLNGEMDTTEGFSATAAPFKTFMLEHVREDDLSLFIGLAEIEVPASAEELPLRVVAPAFLISELRRAFEIGFLLFVPFLVIDLVVASILMGMGMMMLPPVIISLPFKLIFFVLVDGWHMLAGSLVESFRSGPPLPM
jgi:flagellar biosynthesis protein FliP